MEIESSSVMLDLNSLESETCRLLIPYLRTASLMKHYIYQVDLPEIKEDETEFDQLVKFLDLTEVLMDHDDDSHINVNIVDTLDWFSPDGAEMKMWCSEFANLACKDHLNLARKFMRISGIWKQPQLLMLHQNFDQIFQVIC